MSTRITTNPIKILDAIGIKTANFTATAATDLLTSNAHGLKNGDMVVLTTTTTLPAPLATSTVYYVRNATTNTFQLASTADKSATVIDITDTGTGTHTFTMHDIGKDVNVIDFRNVILAIDTDGGGDAAMTVKIQGSISDTCPDFSAAQSVDNQWDYIEAIDLQDGSSIGGDTGFVVAGADDHVQYEVNVNLIKWINCIISGWSEGEVTVRVVCGDNK